MADNSRKRFSEKIKFLIKRSGKSMTQVADELGFPVTTVNNWTKGVAYPYADRLQKLAEYFGVTMAYLIDTPMEVPSKMMTGRSALAGNDFESKVKRPQLSINQTNREQSIENAATAMGAAPETLSEAMEKLNAEPLWKMANSKKSATANELNTIPINSDPSTYAIPIVGRIWAGAPEGVEEDHDGEIEILESYAKKYKPNELLALRVDGESMNKVIPNGSIAIIHKTAEFKNGDIIAVIINGHAGTLKHVYQYADKIIFEPDSWDQSIVPFEYTNEQIQNDNPTVVFVGKYLYSVSGV